MYNIGTMKVREDQKVRKDQPKDRRRWNMLLSDHIARLINEMLEEGGGQAEVRRNDLAEIGRAHV